MHVCVHVHTQVNVEAKEQPLLLFHGAHWTGACQLRLGKQASGPACFCQHFKCKCVTPHLGPLNVGSGDQSQVLTLVWPTLTHWDVFLAPLLPCIPGECSRTVSLSCLVMTGAMFLLCSLVLARAHLLPTPAGWHSNCQGKSSSHPKIAKGTPEAGPVLRTLERRHRPALLNWYARSRSICLLPTPWF